MPLATAAWPAPDNWQVRVTVTVTGTVGPDAAQDRLRHQKSVFSIQASIKFVESEVRIEDLKSLTEAIPGPAGSRLKMVDNST